MHVAGTIADVVNDLAGPAAVMGRIGGEEFAVVAPGFLPDAAVDLAEHLCSRMRIASLRINSRDVTITLSVGVTRSACGLSVDAALSCADDAVYVAKGRGRDQFVIGGSESDIRQCAA